MDTYDGVNPVMERFGSAEVLVLGGIFCGAHIDALIQLGCPGVIHLMDCFVSGESSVDFFHMGNFSVVFGRGERRFPVVYLPFILHFSGISIFTRALGVVTC